GSRTRRNAQNNRSTGGKGVLTCLGQTGEWLTGQPRERNRFLGPVGQEPVLGDLRSEEHTSELQSRFDLVCRLLLEKKNKQTLAERRWGKDLSVHENSAHGGDCQLDGVKHKRRGYINVIKSDDLSPGRLHNVY